MGSWKLEKDIGSDGLPHLLRDLADALENGPGGDLAGMPEDLRKLVLVAELREDGGHRVKLKAKKAGEVRVKARQDGAGGKAAGDAKPGDKPGANSGAKPGSKPGSKMDDAREREREKYRQLKKLLQADYKALQKAAEAGTLPPQDVLESFLALGEAMAEAPQPAHNPAGPEARELARANAAYLEDARELRTAYGARDAKAFAGVLARLERRKSACHAQFK